MTLYKHNKPRTHTLIPSPNHVIKLLRQKLSKFNKKKVGTKGYDAGDMGIVKAHQTQVSKNSNIESINFVLLFWKII